MNYEGCSEKDQKKASKKIVRKVQKYAEGLCCACGHEKLLEEAWVIKDEILVDLEFEFRAFYRAGFQAGQDSAKPERIVVT